MSPRSRRPAGGRAEARRRSAPVAPSTGAPKGPLLGLVVLLVAGALGSAVAFVAAGRAEGSHDAVHAEQATAVRTIGNPVEVDTTDGGRVRLQVTAEVPLDDLGKPMNEVPVDAPSTLKFSIVRPGSSTAGGDPSLTARVVPADGNGAGQDVDLTRTEPFIFNRADGSLVATGSAAHGSHNGTPGAGLAKSAGGSGTWALKLPQGAGDTLLDPSRRWLAVAYPQSGRVELVDLLRREKSTGVAIDGNPGKLRFDPSGRLWALDPANGKVHVIDVTAATVAATIAVGPSPLDVAFGESRAAVSDSRSTTVSMIDTNSLSSVASVEAGPASGTVTYATASRSFVVGHLDGSVSILAHDDGAVRTVQLPADAQFSDALVAPDGQTVVLLMRGADEVAIIDSLAGTLVRTVTAGDEPANVTLLDHFAVIQNAKSPDLTWIDLNDTTLSNQLELVDFPAVDIFTSADGAGVIAPSPAAGQTYKAHVMMGRPMIMAQDRDATGSDVMVEASVTLDAVGSDYELRTTFDKAGIYRMSFATRPGSVAEFEVRVAGAAPEVTVTPVEREISAGLGQPVTVHFRIDGVAPKSLEAVAYSPSSAVAGQQRFDVRRNGNTYSTTFTPSRAGDHLVYLVTPGESIDLGEHSAVVTVR